MKKIVLLIGQHHTHLTEEQCQMLSSQFGGDIVVKRTDPHSADEHDCNCVHIKPIGVVASSKELPILLKAIERGFRHFAFTEEGVPGLKELPHTGNHNF